MTLKELIKSLKNKKIMQDYKVIELYEPNEGEERVVDNAFATGDLLNIYKKLNFLSAASAYIDDVYDGTRFNPYLNRDVMRYKFISDYNYRNEFAKGGVSPVPADEYDLLDNLVIILEPERKIESNFKGNKMTRNVFERLNIRKRKTPVLSSKAINELKLDSNIDLYKRNKTYNTVIPRRYNTGLGALSASFKIIDYLDDFDFVALAKFTKLETIPDSDNSHIVDVLEQHHDTYMIFYFEPDVPSNTDNSCIYDVVLYKNKEDAFRAFDFKIKMEERMR